MILNRRLLLGFIASLTGLSHAQSTPRSIGLLVPWKEATAQEAREELVREMLALGYDKSRLSIILRTANSVDGRLPAL